jgi:serine protease Do
MKNRVATVFLFLLALAVGGAPCALASSPPPSITEVVKPLMPAVVNLDVVRPDKASASDSSDALKAETEKEKHSLGSGFIIDPDGYIVTNRHVVIDAVQVTVMFDDNTTLPAQVVSLNARPDLALLKVNAGHPLPTVRFGDSDALKVGETVIAAGNPLGLSNSISVGVVSALNRDLNETFIDDFIQTDASINHGNSGGPLFNMDGQVIGVNWALLGPSEGSAGLGLAIPSNDVAFVVDQMRRFGKYRAGFAGMRLQQVTVDLARALGLPAGTSGGIITALTPDGPAEHAQMHIGDVVTEFDHKRLPDVRALLRAIGATAPGSTVPVVFWRDRKQVSMDITLGSWAQSGIAFDPAGEQPSQKANISAMPELGLHMTELNDGVRTLHHIDSRQIGVLVLTVAPHSRGANAGIASGDYVLQVGNSEVSSPKQVLDRLDAARRDGLSESVILVMTGDRPHWVALALGQ